MSQIPHRVAKVGWLVLVSPLLSEERGLNTFTLKRTRPFPMTLDHAA